MKDMSEFEKVFGNLTETYELIAFIRDSDIWNVQDYINDTSAASSPECVLFALYKHLEKTQKQKEEILNVIKRKKGK